MNRVVTEHVLPTGQRLQIVVGDLTHDHLNP